MRQGKVGEFEYGECEYLHNCEPIWHQITYGEKNHWRNRHMYANFYCTHSIGPMIHITGLRPVSVVGFEGTKNERALRTGRITGQFGIEMIALENGGILEGEQLSGAGKVVRAAALTYVAALFSAVLQLLRLILIAGGSKRRD